MALVAPGALETRTGGYGYDRRIVDGLRARGWAIAVHELDGNFPWPSPAAKERASRTLAGIPDETTVLVDGLALGAMPDEAAGEAGRLRLIALVHHPLAAETGLGPGEIAAFEASEKRALAIVAHVIVTSRTTAEALAAYDVPGSKISVVEPGTDPAPLSRGSGDGPPRIVCVAAVIPRKGHDILVDGLERLAACRWRATWVGALDRDPAFVSRLRDRLRSSELSDRVTLAGEADEAALSAHYDAADLFVLPTLYEGYGMAVAEALARGLPVVSTRTGAIADLVGDDAGIVVAPGDSEAFGRALAAVVCNPARRVSLAAGARRVRGRLATWDEAVGRLAAVLEA